MNGAALDDLLGPVLGAAPGACAVVAGAVRGGEHLIRCRGTSARHVRGAEPEPAVPGTRFEIGSLTKTFTGLLLAEMVAAGQVGYDDPVNHYLPYRARRTGPDITLLHLATHTSGLPCLPPGLLRRAMPRMFTNPYATYTTADLLAAVPRARLRARPGTRVRYSNFGVGLLGHLLARAAGGGTRYEDLLDARVLIPLGLTGTDCDPYRPQATGYWHGRARPTWLIPGMAGAGALRSTARDMLRYLTALLDPATVPGPTLGAALADMRRPRAVVPGNEPRPLIWNLHRGDDHDLLHHSGVTRGFTAFAGFGPQTRVALVALTNTTASLRTTFVQAAYDALDALAAQQSRSAGQGART
ncbi:CubicO group peptidase, beta-lactamase class C family [Thermomonospora echinospora]|uniref:CubicO group peptidase, beta-lactamase class C family n=1 Tax=Thermomonospora echinospora TaxID=1992 RepID=A0A1H6CWA5_9ACTN|nr:serine hydrolase domain-containing protein [Thermomonospora echinospora]SEG77097.1 CubicO group peptidase, beta-lactamase class C family [Thermomonospora echinospora]